jgi:hypothetical protein
MAIIKSKHASNFTVLPNDIFQSSLSVSSIGMLAYILSLPHDWVIRKSQLMDRFKIGKDALRTILNELEQEGYFLCVRKHGEKGEFEYNYIVYDKPFNGENMADLPYTGEPYTGEPLTDKPTTTKETIIQSTNNTNTLSNLEIFDLFRKKYIGTKRGNKTEFDEFVKKHKDWQQVLPTLFLVIDNQIKDYELKKKRGDFVPEWKNLKTWLNQRCWEQELQYIDKHQEQQKQELTQKQKVDKALDIYASIFPQS